MIYAPYEYMYNIIQEYASIDLASYVNAYEDLDEKFVSYLNSKKIFLESATENCQDIADTVWDQFIDDALAQIKLAQDKKLEEVRQSCTTLTAQCLSDAAETLEDFDSRALSIFGIEADKTAKQMINVAWP